METKSIIQNEHLTRQLDIIDVRTLDRKVVIIGCGAIGSFLTLALAKMGMTNLEVFDHDKVDTVNMSNQFFRFADIGKNKALALHDLVKDFTGTEIKYHEVLFDQENADRLAGAIVVSAVDSMLTRSEILEIAKVVGVDYIIDPRMSAEKYAQYCYTPETFDKYIKTLYSDADAVAERCTAKSTVYTAISAAGIVTKTIKNILMKEVYPKQVQWDIRLSTAGTMAMYPNNMGAFVQPAESETELATDDLLEEFEVSTDTETDVTEVFIEGGADETQTISDTVNT